MKKSKNKSAPAIRLTFLGLLGLGVCIMMLLYGNDIQLLNPKGLIAREQRGLMILSTVIMLAIAVPTLFLFYFFAWKYREANHKATYSPQARHGKFFVFNMWAIPTVFMLVLASIMWPATHKLAPQKSLASDTSPLTIQVVAMRWKWLFIYPEQNIATVNFVQIPTDTPVQFELTADEAPMNSFWIPHLGGQLYAMTGHVNRLNLMADEAGDYPGSAAEISGRGFAGMKFTARVTSKDSFNQWVSSVKSSTDVLDTDEYSELLRPSESNPVVFYAQAQLDLYANLLNKYNGSHSHYHLQHEDQE